MYGYGITLGEKKQVSTSVLQKQLSKSQSSQVKDATQQYENVKIGLTMSEFDLPINLQMMLISLTPEQVESIYVSSPISRISSDISKYQQNMVAVNKALELLKKEQKLQLEMPMSTSAKESTRLYYDKEILKRLNKRKKLDSAIKILKAYRDIRKYTEDENKRDAAAVARGYENEEQAKAIRQVEIEWYFKLYGIQDPIDILAYQRIEKTKFGMTTYDAAVQGVTLEPLTNEDQQNAMVESNMMQDDVAEAEADKQAKKKLYLYGGLGLGVAILGVVYLRSRK